MTTIPANTPFVLTAPLDNVPAGATGQLTRLDSYHVALAFDHHADLVFDITDTDEEVWAAITPVANRSRPSLKDYIRSCGSMFLTIPIAAVVLHYACGGWTVTIMALVALGISRDFVLRRIFTP
jgi:hypothetical protein